MENFKSQGVTLCGDVLLISAFVSYVGYFTKKYRNELMEKFWIPYVNSLKVNSHAHDSGNWGRPWADAATLHPTSRLRLGPFRVQTWPRHARAEHASGHVAKLLLQSNARAVFSSWPSATSV